MLAFKIDIILLTVYNWILRIFAFVFLPIQISYSRVCFLKKKLTYYLSDYSYSVLKNK